MKKLEEILKETAKKYGEVRINRNNPYCKKADFYENELIEAFPKVLEERIPNKFKNADLNDCSDIIKDYFIQKKYNDNGLFLFGTFGVGKTYSMYALAKYFLARQIDVRVINLPSLLNIIRASFSKQEAQDSSGNSEYAFVKDMSGIEKLIKTKILIIDDIGAEKPSDWVAETLYYLINSRYEDDGVTIFTSNLKLGKLKEKIGDRIVSRIAEMCEGNIHEMVGADRRFNSVK